MKIVICTFDKEGNLQKGLLGKESLPVTDFASVKGLAKQMWEVMGVDGVGLAAPQVGILQRFFISNWSRRWPLNKTIFINPVITRKEGTQVGPESCFSMPGKNVGYDYMERAEQITLSYQDLDGKEKDVILINFAARVVQHEIDHLDGIEYIDHVPEIQRKQVINRYRKRRAVAARKGKKIL